VLRYQELGKSVILTGHSNSERGYLKYMATMLQKEGLDTVLSKEDADPLETI
jgi:putative NIF3 family GTP cyclohydrolase 1 type 2